MFTGFFEWENIQALHYSFEWTPDMNIKALLFVLLLVFSTSVQAQKSNEVQVAAAASPQANSLEQRKAKLEGDKLEVEIERLKRWYADWPSWLAAVLGIVAGAASVWVARRARKGAMDQATHERRLKAYPKLVEATSPLAIYFPVCDRPGKAVSRKQCDVIGSEMSKWYFEFGGLLMSGKARDAYFRLARALTRASLAANELDVPEFPVDAENISKEKLKNYREQLGTKLSLGRAKTWVKRYDVDEWTCGKSSP